MFFLVFFLASLPGNYSGGGCHFGPCSGIQRTCLDQKYFDDVHRAKSFEMKSVTQTSGNMRPSKFWHIEVNQTKKKHIEPVLLPEARLCCPCSSRHFIGDTHQRTTQQIHPWGNKQTSILGGAPTSMWLTTPHSSVALWTCWTLPLPKENGSPPNKRPAR